MRSLQVAAQQLAYPQLTKPILPFAENSGAYSMKIVTILFLIALCIRSPFALAQQYAFDVKTQLAEKKDLQIVKQGVLLAIREAPWAQDTEVGEDYSLWITNLNRVQEGDSMYLTVDIELRTPAMLTRGTFIASRRVGIGYHLEQAQEYARNNFDDSVFRHPDQIDFQTVQDMSNMFLFLGMADPLGGALSAPMTQWLIASFDMTPSPVEVMESVYIGQHVLTVIAEMLSNVQRLYQD